MAEHAGKADLESTLTKGRLFAADPRSLAVFEDEAGGDVDAAIKTTGLDHHARPFGSRADPAQLAAQPFAPVSTESLKAQSPAVWLLALFVAGAGIYILWSIAGAATSPTSRVTASEQPRSELVTRGGTAPTGRLTFRSEPSGAVVTIDGRVHGVTPLTLPDQPTGDRQVVLTLDGREVRETVRVEAGGTTLVIAPMTPLPLAPAPAPPAPAPSASSFSSGWVTIVSRAELDVLRGDELIGSTRSPKLMMSAGNHTLRLVNETLAYEATRNVRVEAGKVTQVNVALPQGTIYLNAQPWAEVSINGTPAGETPLGNVRVEIGTHRIVFRHPELGEKTVSTVVKAGAPTRVAVDLRK